MNEEDINEMSGAEGQGEVPAEQPQENKSGGQRAKTARGYKLNAMQCYNRILKIINAKHAFKDRKRLAAMLRQTAKDVCQLQE